MKFDKSKPHGQVWGDGAGAARYVQNGRYFDHDGNEVPLGGDSSATAGEPVAANGAGPVVVQVASGPSAEESAKLILEARRGQLMLPALTALESKAEDVIAELEDHDADLLEVMLQIEGIQKQRKSVIEALQATIAAKAQQAAQDAQANGIQPDAGGNDQLANQLQS